MIIDLQKSLINFKSIKVDLSSLAAKLALCTKYSSFINLFKIKLPEEEEATNSFIQ